MPRPCAINCILQALVKTHGRLPVGEKQVVCCGDAKEERNSSAATLELGSAFQGWLTVIGRPLASIRFNNTLKIAFSGFQ